ncbi:MAG: proline--tRNA ligase [Actinomycetota bacterium]
MPRMALPSQSEDFPGWYQEVVKRAGLAEPSLVRGTMVIKPYGFAIWERIQRAYDDRIKATGHENLYFPMLIPAKLLEKEAEHVEGFAPEVAVVTHAGGEDLEEPRVVRPTSEAIIWATYAKWVQSYRDLPLLYNQWCNVVRWELRPRLFLRTTEFLWQEGHTAHETAEEAMAEALTILREVYVDAAEKVLGLPVIPGRKSASERFPGADETLSMEAMMRDRKALQAGTSHYLGQNFAKAYGVQFQGRDGAQQYAYATSWGVSTRLVGGVIMTHGDDKGLRLPPALAPHELVIVPIYKSDDERARVLEAVARVQASLVDRRVKVDDRDQLRPGFKFNEWELKGVPLRVELGPRDVEAGQLVLARRDTLEKEQIPLTAVAERAGELLGEIQSNLFAQAERFRDDNTFTPKDYAEFKEMIAGGGGFLRAVWCGDAECEAQVKADTKATIRVLPLQPEQPGQPCLHCGRPGAERAIWSLAY